MEWIIEHKQKVTKRVTVYANSEEEAQDKFLSGDYVEEEIVDETFPDIINIWPADE